jgi:transcriptional regulator with XRE-family HTH domain
MLSAEPRTGPSRVKSHDEGYYKALGARIAELRTAKGMTQQQLADKLDVSQPTVGHYEIGRIRLQVSGLQALAEALGVSVAVLLGPLGKPAKPARKRKAPKKNPG